MRWLYAGFVVLVTASMLAQSAGKLTSLLARFMSSWCRRDIRAGGVQELDITQPLPASDRDPWLKNYPTPMIRGRIRTEKKSEPSRRGNGQSWYARSMQKPCGRFLRVRHAVLAWISRMPGLSLSTATAARFQLTTLRALNRLR